jgi:ankyrin repeat protein
MYNTHNPVTSMSIHALLSVALKSNNPDLLLDGLNDDIYAFDNSGNNILHVLIEEHYDDMVDINGQSIDSSMIPYIMVLINKGYDLDRLNREGQSALHIASDHCKDDLVTLLVTHGADINVLNHIGSPMLRSPIGDLLVRL